MGAWSAKKERTYWKIFGIKWKENLDAMQFPIWWSIFVSFISSACLLILRLRRFTIIIWAWIRSGFFMGKSGVWLLFWFSHRIPMLYFLFLLYTYIIRKCIANSKHFRKIIQNILKPTKSKSDFQQINQFHVSISP